MAANNRSPMFSIQDPRRVFPTSSYKHETTTPLSILDASVARFAACSAIWFFDAESSVNAREPALFCNLEPSFRKTLSRWPHWSGQLRWAADTDSLSTPYLGRPVITYGGNSDVGIDWTIATCDTELDFMVPSKEARSTTDQVWVATDLPQKLQAASKLAFSYLADFEGLQSVAVQLTAFKCVGWSLHVKIAHCLSDAQSLLTFMHAWAAQSRKSGSILPQPVFDPKLLHRHAGPLKTPDPELIAKARGLPMHRLDWWADDALGYPDWALASSAATMSASDALKTQQLSPSTHPPWPTWDMSLPVEHVQIHFSAAEVGRRKDAARGTLRSRSSRLSISRLDSLLGHIWMPINRARGCTEGNVYLDVTLGIRSRLSSPLAGGFVGSPLLLAYIVKSGADVTLGAGPIGEIAGEIRSTLTRFTPEAVSAYIHDAAHEVSPQRLWQAFLGSQHTLVTSWTQMKAYEVQFGDTDATRQARYVQGVMPRLDGLISHGFW